MAERRVTTRLGEGTPYPSFGIEPSTRGFSVPSAGAANDHDIDRLLSRDVEVEAGTEALLLVDLGVPIERAIARAVCSIDDEVRRIAETWLVAALKQARSRT